MSTISVLPDILINKIAAGEVIERPASVVRELIDNSIDAGATCIDVEVLHGGKKLIKVSDNGRGMDRDDSLLCFKRHATSKIAEEDDLFDISTLGFRGEALPSIASISKIVLITSQANAEVGSKVEISAGNKIEVSDAPPSPGTMVEVRDIFYNTPARRKFLKTNPTELSHIIETVTQKAFAHPGLSFSLTHNNREILNVPAASTLKERFSQLYGGEFTNAFVDIRMQGKIISLAGFCSRADFTTGSRSHQNIFVNNRPVKNPTINHAVYQAYGGTVPKDRHPAYFLFVSLDPKIVDVNVHPAKREVKFERPDEIHSVVESTIYETLNPVTMKDFHSKSSKGSNEPGEVTYAEFMEQNDDSAIREAVSGFTDNLQKDFFKDSVTSDISHFFHIGEAFVATTSLDGLLIIDRHAAHERILYERFLKKTTLETDPLFLPLRAELPPKEFNLIIKHKHIFKDLGIHLEDFGAHNVIIHSIPRELKKADINSLLLDVASGILERKTIGIKEELTEESLRKDISARLACHKSVRGRDSLGDAEMTKMMSDLEKTDDPERCPHGRPTRILLSLDYLQKIFRRK